MLRMSLPWILQVMPSIDRLEQVQAGMKKQDAWFPCFDAKHNIDLLFKQSIYASYLKISREKASNLLENLERI